VDAALALAAIGVIVSMVARDRYPLNGIMLVALCAGGLTSSQLADLIGRLGNGRNGKPPSSS
jgi:hypothetical protein